MPSATLISLAEPLQSCASRVEVRDRMMELSCSLGFNYFSIVNRKISDPSAVTTTIDHNYSQEWEDLYRSKQFFSKDPANSSIILKQPFLKWSDIPASEVLKSASEYGISNGITCATRGARHICSVSFATNTSRISDEMVVAVRFITSYVANIFAKISEAEDFCTQAIGLSQREQECLFWVCAGKSSWDISRILSISERTVLFHLTNIQKKLQTTTRSHSAAKSVLLGLLDQELFFRSDPFSAPFATQLRKPLNACH